MRHFGRALRWFYRSKCRYFVIPMAKTDKEIFYSQGLRFSCVRCSDCCRIGPGYVFLSRNDVNLLAKGLKMKYIDIVEKYCRWVLIDGKKQLSLTEKPGFDCIFWQEGCKVYPYRPLQCRTFPFWESTLCTRKAWEGLSCPGVGKGKLHDREYIENCLVQRRAEPILTRGA